MRHPLQELTLRRNTMTTAGCLSCTLTPLSSGALNSLNRQSSDTATEYGQGLEKPCSHEADCGCANGGRCENEDPRLEMLFGTRGRLAGKAARVRCVSGPHASAWLTRYRPTSSTPSFSNHLHTWLSGSLASLRRTTASQTAGRRRWGVSSNKQLRFCWFS